MGSRFILGLRGKAALVLSGLLFLILIVTCYASYWQSQEIAKELEQAKLSVLKNQIERDLKGHRDNLLSLHDVPAITAIIRARSHGGIDPVNGDTLQQWQEQLGVIFKAFLSNHAQYFQIRYIDNHGDELVRVEKDAHGAVSVTEHAALQNKSTATYVRQTLKLQQGDTYFSDINLNREHGVIHVPYVPVLRMAAPVYADEQHVAGMIVINLYSDLLFDDIRVEANGTRREVVNAQGYYLKQSDTSRTFAWERGFDYKLRDSEPELAEAAARMDQLIRFNPAGRELEGFQKIFFSPQDHSRYWLLTQHVPEGVIFSDVESTLKRMLMVSLAIGLALLVLIQWFVSRKIVMPVINLARATRALQAGDLSVRVDTAAVSDELRTLYEATNDFAETQQHATERLQAEVALYTRNLAAVIDNIVDGIITISDRGTIESFNPAARRIFGYTDAEVIGQNVKMLMPEPYHSEHDGYLEHHVTTGEKKVIGIGREVSGRRKDGSTFPLELAVSAVDVGGTRHFVGITRDISERKQAEAEIRRMAHYDHLTGLPNRALFHDRLARTLTLAKRQTSQVALLFIDLDGFKAVNDTLGHEAGDRLLQEVALRLQGCLREADTVARLGGDEFAVILSDINAGENVAKKAAMMIAAVSAPYPQIDKGCSIGCSIGISLFPADADDSKGLLAKADRAMYAVKHDGKNHYRFYQQGEG